MCDRSGRSGSRAAHQLHPFGFAVLLRVLVGILVWLVPVPSLAQPAVQVADLVSETSNGDGTDATPMLAVGEAVYFRGRDAAHGWELWRTEGTAESTRLVRDICPGPCDSSPAELAELGGQVYFVADDGLTGRELWRSDGTAAGTLLVRDICPGPCGTIAPFLRDPAKAALVRAGDRLFFRADDASGRELWTSDGTREGTRRVVDLCPGPCSGGIFDLTAVGTEVVFRGDDGIRGLEPWRSDGTAEGTSLLVDFCAGPCPSVSGDDQEGAFFSFQGAIFFWRSTRAKLCWELWTTDPVLRGDGPLPRLCTTFVAPPPRMVELDGALYVGFYPALWKAEGRPLRLQEVARFLDGVGSLTRMGPWLFFTARTAEFGWEIWRSDGTPAGTELLRDLERGGAWGNPGNLTSAGDRLYFTSKTNSLDPDGQLLWVSDGTRGRTRDIRPSRSTGDFSGIGSLTPVAGRLVFSAKGLDTGRELWMTEGPDIPPSAALVRDLHASPGSADPAGLAAIGGRIFLGVRKPFDATSPFSVWRSDGTVEGTWRLLEPWRPSASTLFDGSLFFDTGFRFFRVESIPSALTWFGNLSAAEMQPVGGRLFLSASGHVVAGDSGRELWVTEGTPETTRLVRDIRTGFDNPAPLLHIPRSSAPRDLTPLGSGVLFAAFQDAQGEELWRSDGTEAGTALVKDLCPGTCSPEIAEPTAFGAHVFFTARDAASGRELWVSDGTADGTRLLLDLIPGPDSSAPRDLIVFRERLLFFAGDAAGQEQLWTSDGTAAGTLPVAVTAAAGLPRTRHEPRIVGDRLFFTAWTDAAGQELWVTDGSSPGTRLVADVLPGPASSYPHGLTAVGRTLLFAADDGQTGHELWTSTGTEASTRRLQDIAPGPASSAPTEMTPAGGRILFAADGGVQGRELWVLDEEDLVAATSCVPAPDRLCLAGGRFGVTVRWRDQHNGGRAGVGTAVPESNESGFFWFFAPGNLELVVKILDGATFNGHFWFFYGALSDVEYDVTVTDYDSGAQRTYHNPPGTFCGRADSSAFSAPSPAGEPDFVLLGAAAMELPAPEAGSGACEPGPEALCLFEGRFRVRASWKVPRIEGMARAVPRTDQSGTFWFFEPGNIELLVKILDGRPAGGKFWFFYGALTDVEYTITVTDTATGAEKTYYNPPGNYCGRADTRAF